MFATARFGDRPGPRLVNHSRFKLCEATIVMTETKRRRDGIRQWFGTSDQVPSRNEAREGSDKKRGGQGQRTAAKSPGKDQQTSSLTHGPEPGASEVTARLNCKDKALDSALS